MKDVTTILSSIEQGDPRAAERLLPLAESTWMRDACKLNPPLMNCLS
jgi:hypothetical protein